MAASSFSLAFVSRASSRACAVDGRVHFNEFSNNKENGRKEWSYEIPMVLLRTEPSDIAPPSPREAFQDEHQCRVVWFY